MAGTNVLSIQIFYHPLSVFGQQIFDGLTQRLYNTEDISLEMDVKVPVFQIPYKEQERQLPHFNPNLWKTYDTNIVLVILDEHLKNDTSNVDFLKFLMTFQTNSNNTKIIPVTDKIDIGKSSQAEIFSTINILRPLALIAGNPIGVKDDIGTILSVFYIEFYHILIKLFVNKKLQEPIDKVLLFLSHTKFGGLEITSLIKSFIINLTQLSKFFDVQDIQIGEYFEKEIKRVIEKPETIFITVLTDRYSTRIACKMEVLYAKKHKKPILTINAIENLEKRSFPYLNNTPVVKWENTTNRIAEIIEIALREFLRTVVIEKEMTNFIAENIIKVDAFLSYPPELLITLYLNEPAKELQEMIVVYPNPPIDKQEKELLNKISPYISFITPFEPLR